MERAPVRFIVLSNDEALYERVCRELGKEQLDVKVVKAASVREAAVLTQQLGNCVVVTGEEDCRSLRSLAEDAAQILLPEKGNSEEEVASIRYYVRTHMHEELTLVHLASIIGLSPNYLSALFHRETGIPLNRFIKNTRLQRAAYLLATEGSLIEEISVRVGFSNPSYFSREFKDLYGVTPKAYRMRFRKKEYPGRMRRPAMHTGRNGKDF